MQRPTTQFAIDILERGVERFLRTLDELTLEESNTMPAPYIKSVTWLMWHTARMLDYQTAPLANREQLWFSQGWKERFSLDLPDDTQDWRHTPEEAAKVHVKDKELLSGYFTAAADMTREYLVTLDPDSLDDIVDRSWTPAVTRAVRLVSTVDDTVMHSGQAVYTALLVTGRNI